MFETVKTKLNLMKTLKDMASGGSFEQVLAVAEELGVNVQHEELSNVTDATGKNATADRLVKLAVESAKPGAKVIAATITREGCPPLLAFVVLGAE